jgi:hypothetical protein
MKSSSSHPLSGSIEPPPCGISIFRTQLCHLATLAEVLGSVCPSQKREHAVHVLNHRGPDLSARMADRMAVQDTQREDVRKQPGPGRTQLSPVLSPTVRRAGWPIGSGMVEHPIVNPILDLCNGVCHEQWQDMWQVISQQRREQPISYCHQRLAQQQEARAQTLKHVPVEPLFLLPSSAPPLSHDPAAIIPGTSQPGAHHRLPA